MGVWMLLVRLQELLDIYVTSEESGKRRRMRMKRQGRKWRWTEVLHVQEEALVGVGRIREGKAMKLERGASRERGTQEAELLGGSLRRGGRSMAGRPSSGGRGEEEGGGRPREGKGWYGKWVCGGTSGNATG